MPISLTPTMKRELEAKGWTAELVHSSGQNRRSYYDPKSKSWTAPLPADGPRMAYYLRKGFMLDKPRDEVVESVEAYICPTCGFVAKDPTRLGQHKRTHKGGRR